MDFSINTTDPRANDTRVGWINEPNGRGTWGILVTCISTLLICSWSVMHLNIPPKETSKLQGLKTYGYWCIFGIFGPELVLWTAWQQMLSAKALKDELRNEKACNHQS